MRALVMRARRSVKQTLRSARAAARGRVLRWAMSKPPPRSSRSSKPRISRMALLALLLTGACARSGGAVQAPADEEARLPFELSEEAPLGRHPGAGLCFPTGAPDGWRFTRTHLYDNDLGL